MTMNTQHAISMGVKLALMDDKREIFDQVVDTWREYRASFTKVPAHHRQAAALFIKHMDMTDEHRAKLLDPAWFTDWSPETSNEGVSCWISRKGMIFPIGYADHVNFAYLIGLDGRTSVLERAGWIHVSGGRADIMYEPTALQTKALATISGWGEVREARGQWKGGAPERNEILDKLDRVPRENFVADANFWADEHRRQDDDTVAL